jgi:fluoroacetyl-CoA thioesterase
MNPMAGIPVGTVREENLLVTGEVAISFMGDESARVLSTPHLIGFLEMTARNLIKELIEPGYDSVGTIVNVAHLAATPIGMNVRLRAEVIAAEDRRVNCKVEAWDEQDKIAEGTHERFVVNVVRFGARVQAKAAASGRDV